MKHTKAISPMSKCPTVFTKGEDVCSPSGQIMGLRGIKLLFPAIKSGSLPETSTHGVARLGNSHGTQRFIQPEHAGFSSLHYKTVFRRVQYIKVSAINVSNSRTFLFRRLHSKQPPRDLWCVLLVLGAMVECPPHTRSTDLSHLSCTRRNTGNANALMLGK